MWLFAIFVAIPVIEIALFIQVGGLIGLWPTLGIVIATAVAGSWLVRAQGAREMANLRQSFSSLNDPSEPMANGAMILFAGALLLTPGFFTDTVGLLLLLPPVRTRVFEYFRSRVAFSRFEMGSNSATYRAGPRSTVIDGDFIEVDPSDRPDQPPSGWTKH